MCIPGEYLPIFSTVVSVIKSINEVIQNYMKNNSVDVVLDNISLLWGFPVSLIEDEDPRQTLGISDSKLFI